MTSSPKLADLLGPDTTDPAWQEAWAYVLNHLGLRTAAGIRWYPPGTTLHGELHADWDGYAPRPRWTSSDDTLYGKLAGSDGTLVLRFVGAEEPGTERLQVNVRCWSNLDCQYCWDTVRTRAELLTVLRSDTGPNDPQCDVHSNGRP